MTENTQSIQVLFRVRPLINNETNYSWNIEDDKNEIGLFPSIQEKFNVQPFQFTKIYDDNATNSGIFQQSIQPLVSRLIDGYNCTVLAYGQSSSGKTSTMFKGPDGESGLVFLIVNELFKLTENTLIRIKLQYLEIYNEKMIDLLSQNRKEPLIREEGGQIILTNIEEPRVTLEQEVLKLIKEGNSRRTVSETNLNEQSSRSHAIIRLVLEQGDQLNLPTKKGFKVSKQSCFTLVDLAGSERIVKTNAQGTKLKESNNINQSLMTLGLVINQLAQKSNFVNYRDSKLTRLLQNSLGGNTITFIIGCISPSLQHVEESVSTMRFCQRAMKVVNKTMVIKQNIPLVDKQKMEQLMQQNRTLKFRIQELEKQLNLNQSQCVNMSSFTFDDGELNLNELSQFLEGDNTQSVKTINMQNINTVDLNTSCDKQNDISIKSCQISGISLKNECGEKTVDLQIQAQMVLLQQQQEMEEKLQKQDKDIQTSFIQNIDKTQLLEDMKEMYEKLQNNNIELQKQLTEQLQSCDIYENENQMLKNKINDISEENVTLQKQIQIIEGQKNTIIDQEEIQKQLFDTQQQQQDIHEKYTNLINQRDQLINEQNMKENEIQLLQQELKQQQQIVELNEIEHNNEVMQIKTMQEQNQQKQLAKLYQEKGEHDKILQMQKQTAIELNNQISTLQQQNDTIQNNLGNVNEQLALQQQQFNEYAQQHNLIELSYQQQLFDKQQQINNSNELINQKFEEIQMLECQLQFLQEQMQQQIDQNDMLQNERNQKQLEVDNIIKQNKLIVLENDKKEKQLLLQNMELIDMNNQQLDQKNILNEKLKFVSDQQNQLSKERQKLEKNISELNNQLQIKELFIQDLNNIIKDKQVNLLNKSQQYSLMCSTITVCDNNETLQQSLFNILKQENFSKSLQTSQLTKTIQKPIYVDKSQLTSPFKIIPFVNNHSQTHIDIINNCTNTSSIQQKDCQNSPIQLEIADKQVQLSAIIEDKCVQSSITQNIINSTLNDQLENEEADIVQQVNKQSRETVTTSAKESPLHKVQFYQSSDSEYSSQSNKSYSKCQSTVLDDDPTLNNICLQKQTLLKSPLRCSELVTCDALHNQSTQETFMLKSSTLVRNSLDITQKSQNDVNMTNSNSKINQSSSDSIKNNNIKQQTSQTNSKLIKMDKASVDIQTSLIKLNKSTSIVNNLQDMQIQCSDTIQMCDKSVQNKKQMDIEKENVSIQIFYQNNQEQQCDQPENIQQSQQYTQILNIDKSQQFATNEKINNQMNTSPYQLNKSAQFASPLKDNQEIQCQISYNNALTGMSPIIKCDNQINTSIITNDQKSTQIEQLNIEIVQDEDLKQILFKLNELLQKQSNSQDNQQEKQSKPKLLKKQNKTEQNTVQEIQYQNYFDKQLLGQISQQLNTIINQQDDVNNIKDDNLRLLHQNSDLMKENEQLQQQLELHKKQEQTNLSNLQLEIGNQEQQIQLLQQQLQDQSLQNEILSINFDKMNDKLQEQQELQSSMQKSYFEAELEMTQKIMEITEQHINSENMINEKNTTQKKRGRQKKLQQELPDFKSMYEQSEQKFNRLFQQSQATLKRFVEAAKQREENLQKKAAKELQNMTVYKEIVLKLQYRQKQQQIVQQQQILMQQKLDQQQLINNTNDILQTDDNQSSS